MSAEFVEHVVRRLGLLGSVRARRMFGGHGLYVDETFMAVIDGERLFFKVDASTRPRYEAAGAEPFAPFHDKPPMRGYYELPPGVLERDAALCEWASQALEVARRARGATRAGPSAKGLDLGPASRRWLAAIGVTTRAELEALGSVEAYRRVRAAGAPATLNLLYALEGLLLGLRGDRLSAAVKQNLRERADGSSPSSRVRRAPRGRKR